MARLDKIVLNTKNEDLSSICDLVNNHFDGNLYQLSKFLDKSIYMFHYIPEGEFTELEIQRASFVLMSLKESILESFIEQQSKIA